MEQSPATITIDRWTATALLWIAVGFVFVGGVFLATFDATSVFPSVKWATIAAGIYAFCVTLYLVRPPVRIGVALPLLLLVSSSFVGALVMTENWRIQGAQRREGMRVVFADIGRSILLVEMTHSLLVAFRTYHRNGDSHPLSIGDAFKQQHPTALLMADMKPTKPYWDQRSIIPVEISDSAITLVGYDKRGWGLDPGFIAVSRDTGIVQIRVRMTAKGLTYDLQN